MTPDMLRPAPDLLGRRMRSSLVSGRVTARTAGDAGTPDLDVNSDVRGMPAAFPGHGLLSWLLGRVGGASSFGGLRFPERQAPGAWYSPGGAGGAYGGGWADGILTVRDRHIMTRFGTVRNPGIADSSPTGVPSPSAQAPPPPRYQMVNTTESWQVGADHTANEDNTGEHNWVPVNGTAKRFPLGTQDGTLTLVMGPPLGSWRQYGVRGPAGMHGPAPDVWDPNYVTRTGAGGAGGRGRLVQQGAPGQQPADRRTISGGVPHGLHSPTVPPLVVTGARQASIVQMQPPRVDRPASSKIAGQSMSQTFPPEGSGAARPAPRDTNPGRAPGITSRFVSRK